VACQRTFRLRNTLCGRIFTAALDASKVKETPSGRLLPGLANGWNVMSTSASPAHIDHETVTERTLLEMNNGTLDELFRRSDAGPIPDGDMLGTVLAFPGTILAKPLAAVIYLVGWQGKVVDGRRGMLRNKITPLRLRLIAAEVTHDESWVDQRDCVLLDYSRTSLVAKMVRDEIRLVGPSLYLGVVWLWRRRVAWFTLRSKAGSSTFPSS